MEMRNQAFFEAPSFWKSDWQEVSAYLDGVKTGRVWEIGHSQGGLPIRAIGYGQKEAIDRCSNPFVAQAFGHPEDFFDPAKRTRPVVVIISTVHGVEIEGCVACINLAQIMETGADLRGRRWDELRELAADMRLVLVPLAQPDGRVRSAVRHLVGGTIEDLYYYGAGTLKPSARDSFAPGWHHRYSPIPLEHVEYLGGYTNDAGINIDLDDFFSANVAPETRALLDLVRDETPDAFLVLHSHNPGPWVSPPNALIPERCQYHQVQIGALVAARHQREELRPAWRARTGLDRSGYFGTINLPTALHHVSGGLPIAFEFPHGLEKHPYTFDEILDLGLTLFEEVLRYVTTRDRQRQGDGA